MKKEFVLYEPALELKQIGFDEPCFGYYGTSDEDSEIVLELRQTSQNGDLAKRVCSAPTYQQAFRWFREKYHLIGGIEYIGGQTPETTWWDIYVVGHFNTDYKKMSMKYQPYEEAELACLRKLIEIVKEK